MQTSSLFSSTLYERKTGTARLVAASVGFLLLALFVINLNQQAVHRREVSALRKTIAGQRTALVEQQGALEAKDNELSARVSESNAKSGEIARLQNAVSQQGSQIAQQQAALQTLEPHSPDRYLASNNAFSAYLEQILADGVKNFGADIICELLKRLWNYLVPSLTIP